MEKFVVALALATSAFLYVSYDAGFNFEQAKPQKRTEFVERQAVKTLSDAQFALRSGDGAISISDDQLRVRLRLRAETTLHFAAHRTAFFHKACESYTKSFLDEHGITLSLEFYQNSGAMAGTMSLSPRVCAPAASMTS